DVDDLAVLWAHFAGHDTGELRELAAHLHDDGAGGLGHGVDREPGEQEYRSGPEDHAHEGDRGDDLVVEHGGDDVVAPRGLIDLCDRCGDRVGVGAEQSGRGEHCGGDGDTLGDRFGGVAGRVEIGEDLGGVVIGVATHFGNTLSVVGDRAEGVHRDDDPDGRQQPATGERYEE